MLRKKYQLGHTNIELNMLSDINIPKNLSLFETKCEEVQKKYDIEVVSDLAPIARGFYLNNPDAKQILRPDIRILQTSDKECRIINFAGSPVPYAISIEESFESTKVWISKSVEDMLQYDTIFGATLGLEKVMLRDEALILHSAYMCRDGKAVLFSAPSGTGKSTQAELWERYRGTRQINGDKSLLLRENDGWYAHGWLICGSSEICHNESYPIEAIVMLFQAKENTIRRLGVAESVKKVLSQITINMWNAEFQMKALDLIQELVTEVPVYEMGCDISEDAVICLENELKVRANQLDF